jgi:hypothetical protein
MTIKGSRIEGFQGKYRWLSNFWPVTIVYEGIVYPSTEHAYQAAKVMDPVVRQQVADMATPGEAKKFGKTCLPREDWDQVKIDVMHEILKLKFQDHVLRDALLGTGDAIIEETNKWNDTFWGVCFYVGEGSNHLGKLLMKVREELQELQSK